MTILGRNVCPPPCHPAPPTHTTNQVHHHEQITDHFWISRNQAFDSKVTKNEWNSRLSPVSSCLCSQTNVSLSPLLSKRPSRASYLPQNKKTNHHVHHHEELNATRIQTIQVCTVCITLGLHVLDSCALSTCRCNLSCLSHSLLLRLRFQVESQKPSVGWRRPTAWHISRVFFCKVATDDWALLQKNVLQDKRSYGFLPSSTERDASSIYHPSSTECDASSIYHPSSTECLNTECRWPSRIFSTIPPLPPSYRGRVPKPHLHATTSCLSYYIDR